MALSSESIGTACRTFLKRPVGAAPTRREGDSSAHQIGKAFLDRLIARAQRVVGGVGDGRFVLLVITLVVRGNFGRQPLQLGLGLRWRSEVGRIDLGWGLAWP